MKKLVFDMDGVVCRFGDAAARVHGVELVADETRWNFHYDVLGFTPETEHLFYEKLNYQFWADLEPHHDGVEVFRWAEKAIGPQNIGFLSHPADTIGCCEGKKAWVKRHFPGCEKRVFLGSDKSFWVGPNHVLIDDRQETVEGFHALGGLAVLAPRPWNNRRGECLPGGHFDVEQVIAELEVLLGITKPVEVYEWVFRVIEADREDGSDGQYHLFGQELDHRTPMRIINEAVGKEVVVHCGGGVGVNLMIVDLPAWTEHVSQYVTGIANDEHMLRLPEGALRRRDA